MGINQFPTASSGISSVVNSIQRGVAGGAGSVSISSVNVNKTQVTSFSTGAAGVAAITGNAQNRFRQHGGSGVFSPHDNAPGHYQAGEPRYGFHHFGVSGTNLPLSGGTSTLTAAAHGAYLSDATTLVVTGPCRYEIVEYV